MSFLRKLGLIWYTYRQARALKREGVTDPDELRRLVMQQAISHASGGQITLDLDDLPDVPDEAMEVWENYTAPDEFALDQSHVNLIRRVRFSWNDAEAGAPRVDCERPYGSPDALRDVAEVFGDALVSELARTHADMTAALNEYFHKVALEPGVYAIGGGTFTLTADHLRLARELRFAWSDEDVPWPTPSVNPKRPYGSFTFFQKEMAICLGWIHEDEDRELTDDEISRLTEMHREMLEALQVLASHGIVHLETAA